MRQLSINNQTRNKELLIKNETTFNDLFSLFLTAKKAIGVQDKTLDTYRFHFSAIRHYLNTEKAISELSKQDFDLMIIKMRNSNLAPRSIKSYLTTLRAYLNWCKSEGYCDITIGKFKCPETYKDPYTDEELKVLLQKPCVNTCSFSEYRNWVMINFLLDTGCRSATLRLIQIQDLDLDRGICYYRHTKNARVQSIPLSSKMINILKEYLLFRKGSLEDVLFCSIYGQPLNETALRKAIYSYNKSRGVNKTSVHLFRHTFAKKFLLDCNGSALILQQLLGHTTLDMTKHYCNLYSSDIIHSYDRLSPLSQIQKKNERIKMR